MSGSAAVHTSRPYTTLAAGIVIAAVILAATVFALGYFGTATTVTLATTRTASATTILTMQQSVQGVCLREVPQSATIAPSYNSTTEGYPGSGYTVTYSNGTRQFFPRASCPVPVDPAHYRVDSIVEANPEFISAEHGFVYEAYPFDDLGPDSYNFTGGTYTCTVSGPNGTTARTCTEYTTLTFDLYSGQKIFGCGGSNWIYERLGEIQVQIPLNATGGLELSQMALQRIPASILNIILCTTTSVYTNPSG